ncbi:MAG: hypothetical protein AAFY42_08735 [Pseudomonadota bacterium]
MNGWWGAVGLVVLSAVGIMASSESMTVYKSEGEYVAQCTSGMSHLVPRADAVAGCKCVYRSALPVVEARGDYQMTDKEADMFYDKCLGPVISRLEAEAAWNADAGYSSYADESGWGGESGGSPGWGD